jgi:hypothetical protein
MFGEIMLWWGLYTLAFAAANEPHVDWAVGVNLVSPLVTMIILLCLSGIPTAEGDNQKRFLTTEKSASAFADYRRVTSPLIPLPPSLYGALPLTVKRWLLFEWKMYEVSSDSTLDATPASATTAGSGVNQTNYGAVADNEVLPFDKAPKSDN